MGQDCKRQAMEPCGSQNNGTCSLMEALGYTTVVDERDKAWLHYQIQRAGTPHYKSSAPQNPFKRKIGRSGCRGSANASQKSHCRTLPRASTLIPGFLLSPVCSEEILGKMETDNTFIDSEHVCPHPNFQNGDSGNAQNSNPSGRLGSLPGLKGCYFHIPIERFCQRFLRFVHRSRIYQFLILPFGLAPAPWIFTMVMNAVCRYLRGQGIRVYMYIDDWIILGESRSSVAKHMDLITQLCFDLGLEINLEKSEFEPKQEFIFLGTLFRTLPMTVLPTPEREQELQSRAVPFLTRKYVPALLYQKWLGKVTSLEKVVPLGRSHMRETQFQLKLNWNQHSNPERPIPVTPLVLREITWWLCATNLYRALPMVPRNPSVHLYTDSSKAGWGAHMGSLVANGSWNREEMELHINILEMLAVQRALFDLAPTTPKSVNLSVHGQHYSPGLFESPRWNSLTRPGEISNSDLGLCGPDQCFSPGQTRSCSQQCVSRLLVSIPSGSPNRVDPEPERIQDDLLPLGYTDGRPVRHDAKPPGPPIFLPGPGPKLLGTGRFLTNMGRKGSPIRLPTETPNVKGDGEGRQGEGHINFGGSLGTNSKLVAPVTTDGKRETRSTTKKRSTHSKPRANPPSIPRETSINRVEVISQGLKDKGYHANVVKQLGTTVASSTNKVHSHRWKTFVRYCNDNAISDPMRIKDTQFSAFLAWIRLSYRSEVSSSGTVAGFRAAISSTIKLATGRNPSESTVIAGLIRSYNREDMVPRNTPVPWSLSIVMNALREHPYEPLSEITLHCLTLKTVFLLALASPRRRGEIHAISYKDFSWTTDKCTFTLPVLPTFLSKTQLARGHALEPIVLKSLSHLVGSDIEENRLCPVRCLRLYMIKTQAPRQEHNHKILFIPTNNRTKDINSGTISRWIKDLIISTHAQANGMNLKLSGVKAHQVRAVASSTTFYKSSLARVLQNGSWLGPNTFIEFYLRDLTEEFKDGFKFGPSIIGQTLIP